MLYIRDSEGAATFSKAALRRMALKHNTTTLTLSRRMATPCHFILLNIILMSVVLLNVVAPGRLTLATLGPNIFPYEYSLFPFLK